MKNFVLSFVFLGSQAVFANSVGIQDAQPMLEQMVKDGKITEQQAEITRRYMNTMSEADWKKMQEAADDCIRRNPAAAEKIQNEGLKAITPDTCKIKRPR